MQKKILYTFGILIALTLTSCGLIPSQATSSINAINVDEQRLAIQGYDPVAYFTLNTPTLGSSKYVASHEGAVYHFSTAEHQAMFKNDPEKYAPQYGGYCAFGVTQEKKYPIEVDAFDIVDGKLYLNLNKRAQARWLTDKPGYIEEGDNIWAEIANTPVSEL